MKKGLRLSLLFLPSLGGVNMDEMFTQQGCVNPLTISLQGNCRHTICEFKQTSQSQSHHKLSRPENEQDADGKEEGHRHNSALKTAVTCLCSGSADLSGDWLQTDSFGRWREWLKKFIQVRFPSPHCSATFNRRWRRHWRVQMPKDPLLFPFSNLSLCPGFRWCSLTCLSPEKNII